MKQHSGIQGHTFSTTRCALRNIDGIGGSRGGGGGGEPAVGWLVPVSVFESGFDAASLPAGAEGVAPDVLGATSLLQHIQAF